MNELRQYFDLLDSIGKAANMLDNLHMKPSNKIFIYNIDFMHYAFQLGWEIVYYTITITKDFSIGFRIPSSSRNKENPSHFRIYML